MSGARGARKRPLAEMLGNDAQPTAMELDTDPLGERAPENEVLGETNEQQQVNASGRKSNNPSAEAQNQGKLQDQVEQERPGDEVMATSETEGEGYIHQFYLGQRIDEVLHGDLKRPPPNFGF